jgi:hypothetical protein
VRRAGLAALALAFATSDAGAELMLRFLATDTPLPIPQRGALGAGASESRILAPRTLPGTLVDVDVRVDLNHTFTGDLDLFVNHA